MSLSDREAYLACAKSYIQSLGESVSQGMRREKKDRLNLERNK